MEAGRSPRKFIQHINAGEKGSLSISVFELAGPMGFSHICWQVKLEDVLIFVLFSATESYYVDQAGLELNGSLSAECWGHSCGLWVSFLALSLHWAESARRKKCPLCQFFVKTVINQH